MKTAQIPETNTTRFSFLKGVLQRSNSDDIDLVLQKYPMDLTERQLLELLEILGLSGNISWLSKVNCIDSSFYCMLFKKIVCMLFIIFFLQTRSNIFTIV